MELFEDPRIAWTEERTDAAIPNLMQALRGVGAKVEHADRYNELMLAYTADPIPTPGELLTMDRSKYVALAVAQGEQRAVRKQVTEAFRDLRRQLLVEMRAHLLASVDDYIVQMRPAFDQAADAARECVRLGITSADDPETIMERGPQATEAWLQFARRGRQVQTLNKVAKVRIMMSQVLGVVPFKTPTADNKPVDYSVCFTLPYTGGFDTDRGDWRRWVDLAPNLHLVTSDEITDEAAHLASGDVEMYELKQALSAQLTTAQEA